MEVPKFLLCTEGSDLYRDLVEQYDSRDVAIDTMARIASQTTTADEVQALTDVMVGGVKDESAVIAAISAAEALAMTKDLCRYLYGLLPEVPEQHPQAAQYGVLVKSTDIDVPNPVNVTALVYETLTEQQRKSVKRVLLENDLDLATGVEAHRNGVAEIDFDMATVPAETKEWFGQLGEHHVEACPGYDLLTTSKNGVAKYEFVEYHYTSRKCIEGDIVHLTLGGQPHLRMVKAAVVRSQPRKSSGWTVPNEENRLRLQNELKIYASTIHWRHTHRSAWLPHILVCDTLIIESVKCIYSQRDNVDEILDKLASFNVERHHAKRIELHVQFDIGSSYRHRAKPQTIEVDHTFEGKLNDQVRELLSHKSTSYVIVKKTVLGTWRPHTVNGVDLCFSPLQIA